MPTKRNLFDGDPAITQRHPHFFTWLLTAGLFAAAAGILWVGPSQVTHPAAVPAAAGRVYVQPFGENSAGSVARVAWALKNATEREVVILTAQPLPNRQQKTADAIDAGVLLDHMLVAAPNDAFRVAGITAAPLKGRGMESVTGYARDGERALVLSTYDLPDYATEAVHRRRISRIVAHELGHTVGAHHCDADCVMRDTYSATDIDLFPDHFCARHGKMMQDGLALSLEAVTTLKRLGNERLRLGMTVEAIRAFEAAARQAPRDGRIQVALGVALMAQGRLVAADEALQNATALEPHAPQPYYARAVLYAAGYAPSRASAFIEAAVSRDGDAARAHRAAGILYEDLLEDPSRAARHYQAHVSRGGRNQAVISRLVRLLAPTTLVIERGETIVAGLAADETVFIAALVLR